MKSKLTIIIPGIRPHNWPAIYDQIKESIGEYSFEVIAIGPNIPPATFFEDKKNFRFIRDFGHPSRCLQIAAGFADGEYICWLPDDIIIEKSALALCLDFMSSIPREDGLTLRYSEGRGYAGTQDQDSTYWIARTHDDLKLCGVKEGWKIAPVFLYNTYRFLELGGLDCRFEHINFNTHDLAFRIQSSNGVIHLSPTKVFSADWTPGDPIISGAHYQNDLPLFRSIYIGEPNRLNIPLDNWKQQDAFWRRRHG